jgi:hypothetical protein
MPKPMTEAELLRAVLIELGSHPDVLVYRAQPIVAKAPGGRVIRALPKGHPDVLCCIRGRYVALELKSERGRQTPEQVAFQTAVERAGGQYLVIRDVDALRNVL